MTYIRDCFGDAILGIILCIFFLIIGVIEYKKNKSIQNKKNMGIFVILLFLIPLIFLDLQFYNQYSNNYEIKDTIEIKSVSNTRITPYSRIIGRYAYANISQLVYSTDDRVFLLRDSFFDIDTIIDINYKESGEIIKEMREEGLLSDMADNYIHRIPTSNKFKIKYKETSRYNVITSIERVEE